MEMITNLEKIKKERKSCIIIFIGCLLLTVILVFLNTKYDVLGLCVFYGVLSIITSQKIIYWDTKYYFLQQKK